MTHGTPVTSHLSSIGRKENSMFNPQMLQMINQFKQNPMSMLLQRYNLPQNMNDPNEILKHLVETGQVSQQQIDQAKQMGESFKGLFN